MHLRKLKKEDAPLMLEWMHDPGVVGHMGTNFAEKTMDDCLGFIEWAQTAQSDLHLAVADEKDEYMGTVSLKHIANGEAEFAITVRACAMGTGASRFGMEQILREGLCRMGLNRIYWCVSPANVRAVRFYDKNGYPRVDRTTCNTAAYTPEQAEAFLWYAVTGENR